MTRSPLWIAAYVQAWRDLRALRVFPPGPPTGTIDRGDPMAPAEIARRCAAEADACEAGYVAAFGALASPRRFVPASRADRVCQHGRTGDCDACEIPYGP